MRRAGYRTRVLEEVPVYACDSPERPPERGLRLEAARRGGVAVWPSLSALGFRSLSPIGEELSDIRQQVWTDIDIDGDGEGETLYSVVVLGTDTDPTLGFTALFVDEGRVLRLLRRYNSGVVTIRAVLDIDGDGAQELLLEISYSEGYHLELVTLRDNRLRVLGAWGCGG